MATKTMSQRPNSGQSERFSELASEVEQRRRGLSETPVFEAEEIGGGSSVSYLRPEEMHKETSNVLSQAGMGLREDILEEPGMEGETDQPLDAVFASYGELLVKLQQTQPVMGEIQDELEGRMPVNDSTSFPFRAICRLIITASDNTRWYGTGFMISPRTIITTGHCVYLHEHGGWARSIEVIPGLNNENRPYGSAVSRIFKSVAGWTKSKNRNQDYAAIILPNNSPLGNQTGTFGFSAMKDEMLEAATLNLADFPIIQHTRQAFFRFQKRQFQSQRGVFEGQYQRKFEQTEQSQEEQEEDTEKQDAPRLKEGLMNMTNQLWFAQLNVRSVTASQIRYDQQVQRCQSGAPIWVKSGNSRYVVGIHTSSFLSGMAALRITSQVFKNLSEWKAQGM
ncbi:MULTISPECIES: trypsin-like serine peptidase [Niastella]|uniref:Serine protease n=1 Tax=Niastella soli TaxID=2821487 RepID=A0ABS3YTF3_9BACT|nr:trypsin-like serine protease [Niastella soli]MBO9201196.1 trypsin-like serine protease [Niastella soli]